jgi:hypothetical protein
VMGVGIGDDNSRRQVLFLEIALRIVSRHPHDESPNGLLHARSPMAPAWIRPLPGHQLPMPSQNRVRCDERSEFALVCLPETPYVLCPLRLPARSGSLVKWPPSSSRSYTRFGSSRDHARRCTSKSWRFVISSLWSTEPVLHVSG